MTNIPVILLTGPCGAGKDTALARLLARQDDTRTLLILYGVAASPLEHSPLAHAVDEARLAAGPACACCLPGQTVAKVLVDAPWRFSRQGRRLFDRVVVVCAEHTYPQRLAAALQNDKRLAQRYRLAEIIDAVDTAAPEPIGSLAAETLFPILRESVHE